MISAKVTGFKQIMAAAKRAGERHEKALANAVYKESLEIMRQSKEIVPVDTGELSRSAHVDRPRKGAFGWFVRIGYGKRYAFKQHEDLSIRHKKGQTAKYLEYPLNAARKGWIKRVKARAKKDL